MHKHASTNRFYRLVWSHVHSCWIAVAEGARGRGKSALRKLSAVLLGAAAASAAIAAPPGPASFAPPALKALPATNALPTGAQVVAGQASVTANGSQMTVQQGTDKAILNWQSFDIGANAGVRFVQPGSGSVALNRVLGNDPSRIYGKLDANGKVFLVNGNGVLFGASARVDVGGLVASSLSLPDGDFLAGRYTFSGASSAGAVRNEGSIRTTNGGYVALLAPNVSNAGSIVAANGSVALGAGEQVGVDLRGDGLITLRVERGAVEAIAANSGLVQADGGRVEFSARGADALARATVNNTGIVQARGLVADGGSIRLAGDGDVHAGALDASSGKGKGGQVAVEGNFVALDGAIDAGGASGGSVGVRAGSMLSNAASTSVAGRAGVGGTVALHSGGALVESSSATVDVSGAAKGGSIAVHGEGSVLSSAGYKAGSAQGAGGRIDVSGADVRLLGAQLDASGGTQGGLVRIGGAFQGGAVREDAPDLARFVTRWGQSAPIANASSTFVGDNTAITVAATGRAGQGGTAVVWSDKQTTMLGSIDARGAGAAGTVEISSKDELRHVGLDKIALGSGGQLLLDPKNITIGGTGPAAGQWTYQAIMGKGYSGGIGSDPAGVKEGDAFGMAVALNAAGDRMAVGAPYADGAGGDRLESGAVHLFSFSGSDFSGATLQGTLGAGYTGGKNLDVALPDVAQFGSAVALNANATRLAVGAPTDGNGAVRLFSFGDGSFAAPALTHTIGADYGSANLQNAGMFGTGVALNAAGDRLAVGALYDTGNGSCGACGAVYLFNNAVSSPAFVKAIGAGYGANIALPLDAQFGTSVALDGAGDKLAVGAFGVDDSRGAVYLFTDAYGATNRVATIGYGGDKTLNLPLLNGEGFSAVALNAAGTRLAVGATGTGETGSVRIIDFADSQFGSPFVSAMLGNGASNTEGAGAAAGLETSEWFGYSVALNGLGDRLLVGSPLSDGNLSDNGGYGTVRAFKLNMSNLGFPKNPAASVTVNAAMLATALDSGTSITLQANNDITLAAGNAIAIGDGSGNGSLTLQAGRSISLNSNITTGNANLTLVANETAANGVVDAYRDSGSATITVATGTLINAGSGNVRMTIANGAGKTNSGSGAITIGGNLVAGSVNLLNRGLSNNSNVVIGAAGSITGTGAGLIEAATTNAGSSFINNAGAYAINPGAGRYLVYSNNPDATIEGLSGYSKHYSQLYTGAAPAYAASGNWFLYSTTPTLTVTANAASKTYDGTASLPALGYGYSGLIDNDSIAVLTGSLGVSGFGKNVGNYAINAGTLGNSLGYAINYTGNVVTVNPRLLTATVSGVNKTYDGNKNAEVIYGDNRIGSDNLVLGGTATFDNKMAGGGKTVTANDITLGGNDAFNYTLASSSASTTASIFQRVLNVSASGLNKTYDGGTAANVILEDNRVAGDSLAVSAGTASFDSKQAGTGKTVTVTGITVVGGDAANYTLASNSASTTANVNRRSLTATASAQDKTYDGTTGATIGFNDNRVAGDVLTVSGSGSFDDKMAADGKTVTVTGIALDGQDAGNYYLSSTVAGATANIERRVLHATASGVNRTYDGGTGATVTFSDDRVAGDLIDYSASASFADKMAGDAKVVTVTGIGAGGQDGANYTLASTDGSTTADIARRALTISASAQNKTYDGSAAATVTLGDNRVAGDRLDYSAGASASFADKNAGDAKLVTVSGLALGGDDAANYTLASGSATASANIARRVLTASAAGQDKTYDGNALATVVFNDDRVVGDVFTVSGNASFADKKAQAGKTVSVSGIALDGQDAANYTLASTSAGASASIGKRTLNATAAGVNKTYDGNASADVTFSDDRVDGDLLDYSASASFADKMAANGKTVTVSGVTLGGDDAGNYTLAAGSGTATANIARRVLNATASGANKTYDGNAQASVTLGDNRVAGDTLALSAASASFADKHAGDAKAITVSGLALEGADAANYTLASTTVGASANIGKRTLHASANALDKVYDGTMAVQFGLDDDRVAGDLLTLEATGASFADKHVGSNKAVSVSGLSLSGQDAGNYTLDATVGSTTAAITARTLTVSATGASKVYDGNTVASVTLDDDRVGGDLFSVSKDGVAFLDKNAGAGKAIVVNGIAIDGQDAHNYVLASASTGASADITQRTLHVNAGGVDKVYDGSLAATVTLGDDRLDGDRFDIARNAGFADKNVGAAKAVTVHGLSLSGQDAGNYALAGTTLATSAAITPKALDARLSGSVSKVYDGHTGIVLAAGQAVLDGFAAGEGASIAALDARFGSANVAGANGVQAVLPAGAVSAADGTLLSNYVLPASVSGAGSITPKALGVVGMHANAKVYDGTTAASIAGIGTLDGLVAGESLQLNGPASGQFDNRNAGSGKTVTASGYTIADGANGLASNYTVAHSASANDGVVTQATLTVKANDAKRSAGMPNPVFGFSASGLMAGDSAAILPEFALASEANLQSAPGTYAITIGSPATLQNYQLAYVNGVLDVTGAAPELIRAIRSTIAPALPVEVAGGANLAKQEQRELPRVETVNAPGAPAPAAGPRMDATPVTLSGGTEVFTRNGGVRTAQQ